MFRLMVVAACLVSMGLLAQGAHSQDACTVEPDGGFDCGANGGVTGFDVSPGSKRIREQILALVEDRRAQRGEAEPTVASAQASRSQIRLASAPDAALTSDGLLAFYFGGFGVFEDQNTTDRQIGLQSNKYGGFIGADWKFRSTFIGALVDFSYEDVDFDNKAGDAEQPEIGIGLYGAVDFTDRLYAFAAGRVGLFTYDTDRNLTVDEAPDEFTRSVDGDTNGYNLGIGGGLGYSVLTLEHIALNLSGSLSYFYERYGSYNENEFEVSGQEPRFEYDSFSDDSLESSIAVAVGFPFDLVSLRLVPTISGAWIHEFLRDTKNRKATVSEIGGDLEFPSNRPDRNHFELGAGLNVDFGKSGWSALVSYSMLLEHSYIDRHSITATIRRGF